MTFAVVTNTHSFAQLVQIVQSNKLLFLVSLFFGKSASIVYPPLPGAILTLGSIPLVGWKWAYFIDIIGSITGATIAYFLGKKYGVTLLNWALGITITQKITSIKLKKRNQIESAFILRIAAGGLLSDGLAWGASLIKLNYLPFIIGYILSHLLTTLPLFYLLSLSISVESWIIVLPVAIVAIIILYKLKGRYFE